METLTEEAAADAADTDATDTADEAALDADILAAEEEEGDIIEEDADTDNEGDYMNEGQLDIAEGLKSVDEFFEEDGEAGSDYMDGDADSHNGETVEYYLIP